MKTTKKIVTLGLCLMLLLSLCSCSMLFGEKIEDGAKYEFSQVAEDLMGNPKVEHEDGKTYQYADAAFGKAYYKETDQVYRDYFEFKDGKVYYCDYFTTSGDDGYLNIDQNVEEIGTYDGSKITFNEDVEFKSAKSKDGVLTVKVEKDDGYTKAELLFEKN